MLGINSMVWMYGGEVDAVHALNDLWTFNTSSMQWSAQPQLISGPMEGKTRHTMTRVSVPVCAFATL